MLNLIKDKIFHIVLFTIIIFFIATSIYFYFHTSQTTVEKEVLFGDVEKLNAEIELQDKKEEILPGSLHVPILIYHSVAPHGSNQTSIQRYFDVAPESFQKQLQYLKDNGYTIIALDFLADALEQNILLPPKSIVLTFDDGWENQFKYAYPLLKEYNYTATFFIVTRAIDGELFLTWDEVKTMDENGMEIGAHTRTHPYLVGITDPVTLRQEIIGGKSVIENRIGRPIHLFAYPYGYYNDQVIEIVKEAGFKAARGAYYGTYNSLEEIYKLKGVEVTDDFNKFVQDIKE